MSGGRQRLEGTAFVTFKAFAGRFADGAMPTRVVDLHPVISAIRTPTQVTREGRSDFCNLARVCEFEAGNPALTHASVAEASHYVHDEAPESFARLVEGLLAGLKAGKAAV